MVPYFFNDPNVINHQLLYIAEVGDFAQVGTLVSLGANINTCNMYHETPLFLAVEGNHIQTVKEILRYGGDPNITDEYHEAPLHIAYENNHHLMVLQLLSYGANPYIYNLNQELPHQVSRVNQQYLTQELVDHILSQEYTTTHLVRQYEDNKYRP
ncbi:MAG: ankyrin repeat domain-containing protein [Pseudomonadota bacterium]|nr:ankyrin repeat domain-containing protein [Pseudomonadota bacterium]